MKDKKLLLIVLILVLFVSIGKETYALFTSEVSSVVQNYGTGTLKLSYSSTVININNAYPMSDSDGLNTGSGIITITNTGTLAYKFDVKIDVSSSSTLSSDLIKVSVDEQNPALLSMDGNVIIRDIVLNPGSSRSFALKLWINSKATSSEVLGKKFVGNLTSSGIAVKNMDDSVGTVLIGGEELYDYIKNNADTTTQIDFSKTSEESNTNGIYMTTDTDSGNPVYYYRGNVDNHLLFANFCWRIVRTTETGGVKLIYNGVQKDVYETINLIEESSYTNITNDATYPYTFDSANKTWTSTNKTNGATGTITFSVDTAGDYILSYVMSSEARWDKALFYKNGTKLEEHSGTDEGTISLTGLATSDVIKVEYTKNNSSGSSGSDTVVFSIGKAVGNAIKSCNNTGDDATIGNSEFNSRYTSPADVGYMYGTRYTYKSKSMSSLSGSIVFGNDITYANGTYILTDTYTLTDVSNWSREYTTIGSKYHYTCLTSSNTCEKVNYVYYTSSSKFYYFELSDGKNHLDILKEMLDNSTNTNNSKIKTFIDTWYKNNMISYISKLEDIVFCNDRSYDTRLSTSGWNKDYSNRGSNYLYFNSYQRMYSSYKPTLKCANASDKFTVDASNGNGALTYPVGLITADEMKYAGAASSSNSSFYLYTGQYFWALSPYRFYSTGAYEFGLDSGGLLRSNYVHFSNEVRASVSLKPGIAITGGSGTATDPFVVG